MIDCHCHLADSRFDADLPAVIARAKAADVIAAVVVAESRGQFTKVLDVCGQFPGFLFPALAVHPIQAGIPGASLLTLAGE
jgi:TatD DNase family protein